MSVERARDLVAEASAITVLTGAGISTESGIPDYRGPQGVWTKNPEAERRATLQVWVSEPEVRERRWREYLDNPLLSVEPNDGHAALVELERAGTLQTLVTQNVDGLHQAAGADPDRVIEVHGTVHEVGCLTCGHGIPTTEALDRVRAGEADLRCRQPADGTACGGILKTATISFGQQLDPAVLQRAQEAAESCDLFLAVGTSLGVYPVALLPAIAVDRGATLVIVNAEPTPYDDEAAAVVRGRIGDVLPDIVAGVTS